MIENKGLTRDYLEIPLSNMEKPTLLTFILSKTLGPKT